jgi:hypothetical protein
MCELVVLGEDTSEKSDGCKISNTFLISILSERCVVDGVKPLRRGEF